MDTFDLFLKKRHKIISLKKLINNINESIYKKKEI